MARKKAKQIIIESGNGYSVYLKKPAWWTPEGHILDKILSTHSMSTLADVVRFYGWMNTEIVGSSLYDDIKGEMEKNKRSLK